MQKAMILECVPFLERFHIFAKKARFSDDQLINQPSTAWLPSP